MEAACKAAVLKVSGSPSMVMGNLRTTKAVGAESTVAEAYELGALNSIQPNPRQHWSSGCRATQVV